MALWRDRLAGKRLLLVLDDAASSDQVLPLLPGASGSLVLAAPALFPSVSAFAFFFFAATPPRFPWKPAGTRLPGERRGESRI